MSAAVAGAVVASVPPSGLGSEDVFAAAPASEPALAPSFSVDVDGEPFTLPTTQTCHCISLCICNLFQNL